MLPFDYCCSSVKKELKKRICKVCNQYIPSAYRMKNHYKIHAQHQEDLDHNEDDTLPATTDTIIDSNESQSTTTTAPALKTEMLDWLRSDFDDCNLGSAAIQLASFRVTCSLERLRMEEYNEYDNKINVHVE
ncbi:unnamed protein product [Rotaria sordida]|uniref:C2H2-type domain-containing protein n=1 Tax=Rotaria sordida TaxID=392033 RepID=A0A820M1R1_9BILA|nr:unnamed protein product [Rotaria sordida]